MPHSPRIDPTSSQITRLLRSARGLGLLVMALSIVVACSSGDSASPQPSAAAPDGAAAVEEPLRVALLTPGSIADGGWNAGAYKGLERIRHELGAEISHVETRTPADFEESFRDYGARGYDLVFGHGFEYQDAAAIVGAEYPDTIFVTTSGNTVRENVVPMVFELEQATYICGLMAGFETKTGTVGMIGGIDIPSIRSTFLAFEAGVKEVNPEASVRTVYIGNFDDTAAAREAALALIEEGADFLIHQANEAGRGVFQAAQDRTSKEAPIYVFGTNANQNDMAPDVVIASAALHLPAAFVAVARRIADGTFEPDPIRLGMKDGVVEFMPNGLHTKSIPRDAAFFMDSKIRGIMAGSVNVPRGDF